MIDTILSSVPIDKMKLTSQELFDSYCRNTFDIVSCPNSKCGYRGFSLKKENCKTNYSCEMCNTQWREKEIHSLSLKALTNPSEIKTKIIKFFLIKECPTCFS